MTKEKDYSDIQFDDFKFTGSAKTKKKKKEFLKNLLKYYCIVSPACKATKIGRTTHYNWLESDEEYRKAYNLTQEDQGDYVESKLFQNIKAGNVASINFYLERTREKYYKNELQNLIINQNKELSDDDLASELKKYGLDPDELKDKKQ